MLTLQGLALVSAAIGVIALLAGCSGNVNPRFGGYEEERQPGYEEHVEDQRYVEPEEPTRQEIDQAIQESDQRAREQLGLGAWSCTLSITYNDDWHDDVVCRNGNESHRPYLREWDSFVEQWEILESAAEYEAKLNASN